MLDLNEIRGRIDKIDQTMVELFEERMAVCREVAQYKIDTGKPVLDRDREKQKIAALRGAAHSEFNARSVEELFTQIMAMSRKMQYQLLSEHGIGPKIPFEAVDGLKTRDVRVVFQGVDGAYSQAAMKQYFGETVESYHVPAFFEAMKEVQEGRADYAVLPIENSSAGMVADVYDLLMEYDNAIVGECYLKVEHALLGLPGASMEDVKTVYSHPQGLMQCAHYLDGHRDWKRISLANTALSAQKVVKDQDKTQAAIASELAGKIHGLVPLDHKINDNKENTTRFIIVAAKKIYTKEAKKVSICFEIAHESGSLYNTLSHMIFNNLNMTKIESRPIPKRNWEYRFYVDFEGNLSDPAVQNALVGLDQETGMLKILGNY